MRQVLIDLETDYEKVVTGHAHETVSLKAEVYLWGMPLKHDGAQAQHVRWRGKRPRCGKPRRLALRRTSSRKMERNVGRSTLPLSSNIAPKRRGEGEEEEERKNLRGGKWKRSVGPTRLFVPDRHSPVRRARTSRHPDDVTNVNLWRHLPCFMNMPHGRSNGPCSTFKRERDIQVFTARLRGEKVRQVL